MIYIVIRSTTASSGRWAKQASEHVLVSGFCLQFPKSQLNIHCFTLQLINANASNLESPFSECTCVGISDSCAPAPLSPSVADDVVEPVPGLVVDGLADRGQRPQRRAVVPLHEVFVVPQQQPDRRRSAIELESSKSSVHTRYRGIQQVSDLGWVDFDLDVSHSSRPAALPSLPISDQPISLGRSGQCGIAKIKVNPTQVWDLLNVNFNLKSDFYPNSLDSGLNFFDKAI